jgi:hypothetical protein
MVPAIAIDGSRGPALPRTFRIPVREPAPPPPQRRREPQSPLPEEWSEATRVLREAADELDELLSDR